MWLHRSDLHCCMSQPAPTPAKRDGAATRQKLIRAARAVHHGRISGDHHSRDRSSGRVWPRGRSTGTSAAKRSCSSPATVRRRRGDWSWSRGMEADGRCRPRDRLLAVAKRLVGAVTVIPRWPGCSSAGDEEGYLDDGAREAAQRLP